MKLSAGFLAALTLIAPFIAAAANVVSLDFVKGPSANHGHLAKRSVMTENVTNWGILYWAQVEVGTPPQALTLQIDTGSTDTWVMTNDSGQYCKYSTGFNTHPLNRTGAVPGTDCYGGYFTPNASSTYNELNSDGFEVMYEDLSGVSGPFFEDNFAIGGVTVKSLQMGLGEEADEVAWGIMGLSYDTDEFGLKDGTSSAPYPSLLDQLVSQNIINAPFYSLWLDDVNATTGSILFGGVDVEKFTGELSSIPILSDPNGGLNNTGYDAFYVSLAYLGFNGASKIYLSDPVVLDSGTSYILLPQDLIYPIVNAYGGVFNASTGLYDVPCNTTSIHPDDYLEFQFGVAPDANGTQASGPTIRLPLSEIVVDAATGLGLMSNTTSCNLGLVASDGVQILGDTFLRSAYVVFDLKNNEIGIAQAYFGSNLSSVVEIESNATTIPCLCGKNGPECTSTTLNDSSLYEPGSSEPQRPSNPKGMSAAASDRQAPGFDVYLELAMILAFFVLFR